MLIDYNEVIEKSLVKIFNATFANTDIQRTYIELDQDTTTQPSKPFCGFHILASITGESWTHLQDSQIPDQYDKVVSTPIDFVARVQIYGAKTMSALNHLIISFREDQKIIELMQNEKISFHRHTPFQKASIPDGTDYEQRSFTDISFSTIFVNIFENVDYFNKVAINQTVISGDKEKNFNVQIDGGQ